MYLKYDYFKIKLPNNNGIIYCCCALPQHITTTMASEMSFYSGEINEDPSISKLYLLGNLNRLLTCEMLQYILSILL